MAGKAVSVFLGLLRRTYSGNIRRTWWRVTVSRPREFSNSSGRQLERLPLQILISVALDSCGGNSPVANAGRLKKLRGVLL